MIDEVDSLAPTLVGQAAIDAGDDAFLDFPLESLAPFLRRSDSLVSFLRCDGGKPDMPIRIACDDLLAGNKPKLIQ